MSPILFTDTNPHASISLLEDGRMGEENGIPFMNAEDRRTEDPIHSDGNIVICDLDGTIAKPFPGRSMYTGAEVHKDTVCKSLALMIEKLFDQGYQIYMISARSATELAKEDGFDKERVALLMSEYGEATGITNTFHWLRENFIPFDKLILRPAGESKQDIFMKQEIFKTFIKDPAKVYCAFDDNGPIVDLWRSYGIQTYQCAPSWDNRELKEEAVALLNANKANPNRWC